MRGLQFLWLRDSVTDWVTDKATTRDTSASKNLIDNLITINVFSPPCLPVCSEQMFVKVDVANGVQEWEKKASWTAADVVNELETLEVINDGGLDKLNQVSNTIPPRQGDEIFEILLDEEYCSQGLVQTSVVDIIGLAPDPIVSLEDKEVCEVPQLEFQSHV